MTKAEPQSPSPTPTRADGFTMIEVVAAVVILGLWFTVLVTIVSGGVSVESLSRLRLEASLVADEALADAEAALLTGAGVTEIQLEDDHIYGDYSDVLFDVSVTAAPFDPLGSLAPREGAAVSAEGLGIDVSRLPPEQQTAALAALLEIRVEVYRAEGEFDPLESHGEPAAPYAMRTTYVVDPAVLASLDLPTAPGIAGSSTGLGNDENGPDSTGRLDPNTPLGRENGQ
jgi:prepilin-type N-terminal cleavage/methylation domain-containing protein